MAEDPYHADQHTFPPVMSMAEDPYHADLYHSYSGLCPLFYVSS
jgi:hypothetical protein